MTLPGDMLQVLQETSRTFFLPIRQLSPGLQEAVASAYLCLRALDEIEDHPHLSGSEKSHILDQISQHLQAQTSAAEFPPEVFLPDFAPYQAVLPAVTLRLAEWACYPPASIAPRIWEATAAMAERMPGGLVWLENPRRAGSGPLYL